MTPQPFTPGFANEVRMNVQAAIGGMGMAPVDPLSVPPVTARVSQGNPSLVERLLDPRQISAAEWAEIEEGL